MTIKYKGADKECNYRTAIVSFEDVEEINTIDRIAKVMNIKGWKDFSIVADGVAFCKVDDFEQYKELVIDYKEVKKAVRLWKKYGI